MAKIADFDVGIIMGSKCEEIFAEEAAKHPGLAVWKRRAETVCKCGKPECFRRTLQYTAKELFQGKKTNFLLFLDELAKVAYQPPEVDLNPFFKRALRKTVP